MNTRRTRKKLVIPQLPPMEEIISVSLPDIPDGAKENTSTKSLGGEITFAVDAGVDESTKLKLTKELLTREAETSGLLGRPSHIRPFIMSACDVAAEENDYDFNRETRTRLAGIEAKIKKGGPKSPSRRRRGKIITSAISKANKKANDLIDEVIRRSKAKGLSYAKAYDEIESNSCKAGSKWLKIIGMKSKETIIDMASHHRHYKELITEKQQR